MELPNVIEVCRRQKQSLASSSPQQSVESLSGVYYVHLPEVLDECGTEFAMEGPEGEPRHMEPPRIGQWVIYPSHYWHRPGVLKSKQDRYIVAADLWY